MTGLQQAIRHAAAHVAESDECDGGHVLSLFASCCQYSHNGGGEVE
jgi:hypothetical protein